MTGSSRPYRPAGRERVGLAARNVALALLERVVDRGKGLDGLLDPDRGYAAWRALIAKDRALARAIVVTALRHRAAICRALDAALDRPPPAKARHLLHGLHVAAAQILFMDIPDHAAIDLAVTQMREDRRSARFAALANAVLRRIAREPAPPDEGGDGWRAAFPDWLAARMRADHGRDAARAVAAAMRAQPPLDLTPDPRLSAGDLRDLAAALDATLLPTGTLRLESAAPVEQLPFFREGRWWVQDAAAALPARLLGDVRGLRVADCCAAPGGKTAQLAAAGAAVTAIDRSASRLRRLRENLDRLHLAAECVEDDMLAWRPETPFDAVLLDVPCSATGTLRRHPDVVWTGDAAAAAALAELQRRMILAAREMVRPGGLLVYANCSILKQEGEDLLAALDPESHGLAVVPVAPGEIPGGDALINGQGALRTLPCDDFSGARGGMDGFFAVRFRVVG